MGFLNNSLVRFFRKSKFREAGTETAPASSARSYPEFDYSILGYSKESSLRIATVYRCVSLLAGSVASLPLQFMRLKSDLFVEDRNSNLYYLLNVQPNADMSAFDFWFTVIQQILLQGNAYILPRYSTALMDYSDLVLITGSVSYDEDTKKYTVDDDYSGIEGVFSESEIIHLKNITTDGINGKSVLSFQRETTDIAFSGAAETFRRFSKGGNVKGFVSNGSIATGFGEYQDAQLDKAASDLSDKLNSGKDIVSVPGSVEFKQLTLSSVDMQFLESRKFTVREICRFFGVHPSFVFDDTSNNYKSAETANVAFLINTLNPLLRKIENELLRKLITPSLATKRKFQFDRRGMYASDLDGKIKYQAATIAAGIYTVNEWRREENKPDVEGGDRVLISANLRGIDETSSASSEKPNDVNTNNKNSNNEE